MSKKIAIDISAIIYGTGVSVYTKELVRNLLKIDEDNEYILFGYSTRRRDELEEFYEEVQSRNTNKKFFSLPPTLVEIWANKVHKLPLECFLGDVDLVHTSDWVEPPVRSACKVTTVHDLTPMVFPELTHPKIVKVHKRKLHWSKKESNFIVTPSYSTKNDLVKMGFDKSKLVVVYEAVRDTIKRIKKDKAVNNLKKLRLPSKFYLMVGTAKRKNITNTCRAVKLASKVTGIQKVIVVGEENHGDNPDNALFLGRVNDLTLSSLYSIADAFLYTSYYEGFGMPVLEAFRCGCPVVASNVSSIPEISGGACIMVDPQDEKSIAEGIKKVFKHKEILIKKGTAHEKKFTWHKNAIMTHKIYNKLLKKDRT